MALVLIALTAPGCSGESVVDGVSEPPPACDAVPLSATATWVDHYPIAIVPASGGCGRALVLTSKRLLEVSEAGEICRDRPLPADLRTTVNGWNGINQRAARIAASDELLLVNKDETQVHRVTVDAVVPWVSAPESARLLAFDRSPCGDGYLVTSLAAQVTASVQAPLRRVDKGGQPIWVREGRHRAVLAECSGAYAVVVSPTPHDVRYGEVDNALSLVRLSNAGDELWRHTWDAQGTWTLAEPGLVAAFGGVAVTVARGTYGRTHFTSTTALVSQDGEVVAGLHPGGWSSPGYVGSLDEYSRPVPWPQGRLSWAHTTGYRSMSKPSNHYEASLVIRRSDGQPAASRPLGPWYAMGIAKLGDGSLVAIGHDVDMAGHFVRLPPCVVH